jgi:hypothetical protein
VYRPSLEERAILRTVVYASVFDYPLTLTQLQQTLVESSQTEAEILARYRTSAWLRQTIDHRDGLFFPRGHDDIVAERSRREAASREFIRAHQRYLRFICAVPFTRLVALSGSVAHLNMDRRGDLDLFIVTRGARVWSVAVVILLMAKLAGRRKITCVNYVLSDRALTLDQRDLFTANQVISLRPLIGSDVFQHFVRVNDFVARFYPNFDPVLVEKSGSHPSVLKRAVEIVLSCGPAQAFERVCRSAYGWYLRRRASGWTSPEQVRLERECLKLHTNSHRGSVTDHFEAALAEVESLRRFAMTAR